MTTILKVERTSYFYTLAITAKTLVGALIISNDTHAERTPNLKGYGRGFRKSEGRDSAKGERRSDE